MPDVTREQKLLLGIAARDFLDSDLCKYVVASMREKAVNMFAQCKPSDDRTQKDAKLLLGAVDLFAGELLVLRNSLAVEKAQAEHDKRSKKGERGGSWKGKSKASSAKS